MFVGVIGKTPMINLSFSISWPFFKDTGGKDYFYKEGRLFGHKYGEIQISKMGDELLGFHFRFDPVGSDHGGLQIEFNFLRRMLALTIYDSRHWNHEEKRWYRDGEDQGW